MSATVKIEDASIKHLDRLFEIEMECFKSEAFTKQQIAQLLTNHNCISLIAKENDKIIGFIIGTVYVEDNVLTGHVLTIDVSPNHRRKGTGIKLLHELEKIFKEKHVKVSRLEVREDNVAALSLYQKLGYKKVGKLHHYYGDAHGILLEKLLAKL
ncbi:MAG: ribosomal protein S18-alanine N-acetyltransferase [Candidatus Bathyarchaeia archaeon]